MARLGNQTVTEIRLDAGEVIAGSRRFKSAVADMAG
jgi:hypothetical protein